MSQTRATPGLRYGCLLGLVLAGCLLLSPLFLLLAGQGGCSGSSLEGPITPPPPGDLSAGQMVRWLESQGDSANASAGIVGNLEQESQLNPTEVGGGLAQWKPGRYGEMAAYAASVGLSPTSDQGQLVFLQYDLRTSYSSLLSRMDTAPDPGTSAEMFETTYELCQGVVGYMDVIPDSLCEDANRKLYAARALAQAGGSSSTTVPVSLAVLGGSCTQAAAFGSGKDPIPSPPWAQGRDDMGVDASAPIGAPIYAPAGSTLVEILPWFPGPCGMQPLMLFHFNQEQAGTEDGDQYWYVAEQITPVTQRSARRSPRGNRWRISPRAEPGSRSAGGRRAPVNGHWRRRWGTAQPRTPRPARSPRGPRASSGSVRCPPRGSAPHPDLTDAGRRTMPDTSGNAADVRQLAPTALHRTVAARPRTDARDGRRRRGRLADLDDRRPGARAGLPRAHRPAVIGPAPSGVRRLHEAAAAGRMGGRTRARAARENTYRSGPSALVACGTHQLPGLLAASQLSETRDAHGRPFAVLCHPHVRHMTVVLESEPDGASLADPRQVDQWVAHHGEWLAALSREPG